MFCLNVFVHHMCAWYPWRPEKGAESPGIGRTVEFLVLMWILGTKSWSSAGTESALSSWAGSLQSVGHTSSLPDSFVTVYLPWFFAFRLIKCCHQCFPGLSLPFCQFCSKLF